jgi:hypothetical protein
LRLFDDEKLESIGAAETKPAAAMNCRVALTPLEHAPPTRIPRARCSSEMEVAKLA